MTRQATPLILAALCLRCAVGPSGDGGPPPLRGEFSYFADAAMFVACDDGTRYPVGGTARPELERAYLKAAFWPGDAVLIEVRGDVEQRPAMEGDGQEATLVVTKLERVAPREWCFSGSASAAAGTYSVDMPAASSPGRRISLALKPDGGAVFVTDFMNDFPAVVQRGNWKATSDDTLRFAAASPSEKLAFRVGRQGDLLYLGERFGSVGLKLKRSRYRTGAESTDRLLQRLEMIVVDYGGQVPEYGIPYEVELSELLREEHMWMSLQGLLIDELGLPRESVERNWSELRNVREVMDFVRESE